MFEFEDVLGSIEARLSRLPPSGLLRSDMGLRSFLLSLDPVVRVGDLEQLKGRRHASETVVFEGHFEPLDHRSQDVRHAFEHRSADFLRERETENSECNGRRAVTYDIFDVIVLVRVLLVEIGIQTAENEVAVVLVLHQFLHAIDLQPADALAVEHVGDDLLEELLVFAVRVRFGLDRFADVRAWRRSRWRDCAWLDGAFPLCESASGREREADDWHGEASTTIDVDSPMRMLWSQEEKNENNR